MGTENSTSKKFHETSPDFEASAQLHHGKDGKTIKVERETVETESKPDHILTYPQDSSFEGGSKPNPVIEESDELQREVPRDRHTSSSSRFRFKDSSKRKSHREDLGDDPDRHRRKRKRRKERTPVDHPSLYDNAYLPNTSSSPHLDPEAEFREHLFDAMADDEGAAFWEGVYGQPLPQVAPVKETPQGTLEAMTEEEYVAHVRAEMYKKTHQHLLEEKERREKAKAEKALRAEQERRERHEIDSVRDEMMESLRRGKLRKTRLKESAEWSQMWRDYEDAWKDLSKFKATDLPWPVRTGSKKDLDRKHIEDFFLNGPTGGNPEDADLWKTLKLERIRWHPDKVQHKLGGSEVDETRMRGVTAVFQIIDRMWTDTGKQSK